MDQRAKQMVEGWKHRNSRENSRCWKDVCGARSSLSLAREGGRGDGCWSDVFQRDSPARSSFEEHFSELHSYFGSKSSGLIKMGRGLYAPSTRGRPNRGEI